MTCIKIKDKQKFLNRLARDGKENVAGMLENVDVMDSREEETTVNLNLSEDISLGSVILADSWNDLKVTPDTAEQVGDSLRKLLALDNNPISETEGKITYALPFSEVQNSINQLVHSEFLKTRTSIEESTDFMITTPIESREKERIKMNNVILKDLRAKRDVNLSMIATNPRNKRTLETDLKGLNERINVLQTSVANSRIFLEDIVKSPSINEVFIKAKEDLDLLLKMTATPEELNSEKVDFIRRTANLWRGIMDIGGNNPLELFDEFRNDEVIKKLAVFSREFGAILAGLEDITRELGVESTNKRGKVKVTPEILYDSITKDSNIFAMNLRSLGRSNNPLLQSISDLVDKTNNLILSTFKSIEKSINEKYNDIRDAIGTNFDIFIAKDKHGRDVGSLVDRFTHDFWVDLARAKKSDRREGREWLLNNTRVMNFFLLYDDESDIVPSEYLMDKSTQKDKDEYRKEMIDILGIKGFNEQKVFMDSVVNQYKIDRDIQFEAMLSVAGALEGKKRRQFELEDNYASPFKQSRHAISGTERDSDNKFLTNNRKLQIRIPRQYNKATGKRLDYYDNNYAKIENNKKLLVFHDMAKEIIKEARVSFGFKGLLHPNALPYLEQTLRNQINGNGSDITKSAGFLGEAALGTISGKVDKKEVKKDAQGREIKEINKNVVTINQVARQIFEYKVLQFKSDTNGANPTPEAIEIFEADALAEAGANQDLDLPKLLKVLSLNAIAFRNKTVVKAEVEMLTAIVKNDNEKRKQEGELDIKNGIAWMENTMNSDFYNTPTRIVRQSLGRTLSKDNKKKMALLNDAIARINSNPDLSDEIKQDDISDITVQKEGLYKTIYLSEVIRQYLGYSRILGIGYNAVSSLTNALFGQVGNFQRAIQGDEFDVKELQSALRKVFISDREKVSNISGKIMLVGDVTYSFLKPEEEQKGTSGFATFAKYGNPYFLQTFSEEFNQSPIMVAMMTKLQVTNEDGQIKNFYDIIDKEGNVDDTYSDDRGLSGEALLSEVTADVRRIVQETHGDYNSTFLANNEEWKQALLMFKRWLPEMFYRRFGSSGTDYMSGKDTTGIYIQTRDILREAWGDHDIGDLLKVKTLKEINAKLTPEQRGKFRAAVIGDFGIYFAMVLMSKMLADMFCDEPGCTDANQAQLWTLNILNRLDREVGTFFSPMAWVDMINNPVSSVRTLYDVAYFFASIPALFQPDKESSYFTSGRNEGMNKALVKGGKLTPFFGQMYRLYKYGNEATYEKPLGSLWHTIYSEDDNPN